MTKLTLDIPDPLAQALQSMHIDEQQARQIALAALAISAQQGIAPLAISAPREAAAFARRLIDENRALFEELAGHFIRQCSSRPPRCSTH